MLEFKRKFFNELTRAEKIVRIMIDMDWNTRRYNELLVRDKALKKQYRRISKKRGFVEAKLGPLRAEVKETWPETDEKLLLKKGKLSRKSSLMDYKLGSIAWEQGEISIEQRELEDEWDSILALEI